MTKHPHKPAPNTAGHSCCGGHSKAVAAAPAHTVKDPVCGMTVDPHTAKHRAEHNGHPYYFCSNGCRTKFEADPSRYLDPASAAAKPKPVPEGTIYTCPMHPEVRQVGPGACPICGMALARIIHDGGDGLSASGEASPGGCANARDRRPCCWPGIGC